MNKIYFILIIALSLLFNVNDGYAQKSQLSTKWQSEQFNIPESLSNMDFLYDSKGKLLYLLTNDEGNLYVHIRVIDEDAQKKLLNYGFSVELKSKGNKNKQVIEYPLPKVERMEPILLLSDNSNEKRNDFNLIKKQTVNQIVQMRISGFFDQKVSIINCDSNNFKINGSMTVYENGNLQYLLTIPMSSLGLVESKTNSISILLKSGSLDVSNNNVQQLETNGGSRNGAGVGSTGAGGGSGLPGGRTGIDAQQRNRVQSGASLSKEYRIEEVEELSIPIKIKLKNIILLIEPKI